MGTLIFLALNVHPYDLYCGSRHSRQTEPRLELKKTLMTSCDDLNELDSHNEHHTASKENLGVPWSLVRFRHTSMSL